MSVATKMKLILQALAFGFALIIMCMVFVLLFLSGLVAIIDTAKMLGERL